MQLLAALERAVVLAVLDQVAGHQLVQAGDVAQQRHAGRVQVHADGVDARLDDAFQRLAQLLGVDVVLVQADADVLRVDLDQFAERVLQAAADGDGAAQGGVEVGELLAADGAGRVDAGAGLVDDDVGQVRPARRAGRAADRAAAPAARRRRRRRRGGAASAAARGGRPAASRRRRGAASLLRRRRRAAAAGGVPAAAAARRAAARRRRRRLRPRSRRGRRFGAAPARRRRLRAPAVAARRRGRRSVRRRVPRSRGRRCRCRWR